MATIQTFREQFNDFSIDVIFDWCNKWKRGNHPIPCTYSLITSKNQHEVKEDQSVTTMLNQQIVSYNGPGYLYEFDSTLPKNTLANKTSKEWYDIIQNDLEKTPCDGYCFWGLLGVNEPLEMDDNTFLKGEYVFVVIHSPNGEPLCGLFDPKDSSNCVKVGTPTITSFLGWSDFPQVVAS